MAGQNPDQTPYEEQRKEAEKNLIALGYARPFGGTFAAHNTPGETDMNKFQIAIRQFRQDHGLRDQPYAETFTSIKTVAKAQEAAAAARTAPGPQAAGKAEGKVERKVEGKADNAGVTQAAPRALSAEDLKQQEASAYLRVLGKTYDQFKAENALANGADLAGKGATSPEALAALKARVTGSPEAAAFAREMLEKDATQDRKPGLRNADLRGDDVIALQYMLKANGQDIGAFAHEGSGLKDGIDGIMGRMTREATENIASPDLARKGPAAEAAAPAAPAAPARTASGQAPAPVVPAPVVSAPENRAPQGTPQGPPLGLPVDGGARFSGRSFPAAEEFRASQPVQPRQGERPVFYQQTYGNNQYREMYNRTVQVMPQQQTYAQPINQSPFERRMQQQDENFELRRRAMYQNEQLRQEQQALRGGGGYYPGSPMGGAVHINARNSFNAVAAAIGLGPNGLDIRNGQVHLGDRGGQQINLSLPRIVIPGIGGLN